MTWIIWYGQHGIIYTVWIMVHIIGSIEYDQILHPTIFLSSFVIKQYKGLSDRWIQYQTNPVVTVTSLVLGAKVIWKTKSDDEIKLVTSLVWTDMMTRRTRRPFGILYVYLIEVKPRVFGIIMASSTPI